MNSYHISTWIVGLGLWPLIIAIAPNLIFRRYGQAAVKKRMASLYHALAVFCHYLNRSYHCPKGTR